LPFRFPGTSIELPSFHSKDIAVNWSGFMKPTDMYWGIESDDRPNPVDPTASGSDDGLLFGDRRIVRTCGSEAGHYRWKAIAPPADA